DVAACDTTGRIVQIPFRTPGGVQESFHALDTQQHCPAASQSSVNRIESGLGLGRFENLLNSSDDLTGSGNRFLCLLLWNMTGLAVIAHPPQLRKPSELLAQSLAIRPGLTRNCWNLAMTALCFENSRPFAKSAAVAA
ncbi:MAG: hypothetical protein V3T83_15845, partial [Acidobacteriota bacterium]